MIPRFLDTPQRRELSARAYVYVLVDGVYLQARMEPQAERMLVVIGATPEGDLLRRELCRHFSQNLSPCPAPAARRDRLCSGHPHQCLAVAPGAASRRKNSRVSSGRC